MHTWLRGLYGQNSCTCSKRMSGLPVTTFLSIVRHMHANTQLSAACRQTCAIHRFVPGCTDQYKDPD